MSNFLRRSGALFLAVFVLFVCLIPAAPVHASALIPSSISGTWVLGDSLNPASAVEQSVNFTVDSGNIAFTSMKFSYVSGTGWILYFDSTVVCRSATWVDEIYKTVDFGETAQTVSEDFFNSFANTATFLPPPPDQGPLVEVMTDLQGLGTLDQVLDQIVMILPIGLACWISCLTLRKGLMALEKILSQS